MNIPEFVKTRDGVLKYVLKKAVQGLIPDQLIDRKKQGFHVPVHEWFFESLGERIRKDLGTFCQQTDLLDVNEVDRLLQQGRGNQAWYLLNFALWWNEYIGE